MSRTNISLVVAGDTAVGKSSLISTLVSSSFSTNVPHVLQPVVVPSVISQSINLSNNHSNKQSKNQSKNHSNSAPCSLTIVDTSPSSTHWPETSARLRSADAIILVADQSNNQSVNRIITFWLHRINEMKINAPVIVAINKSPLTVNQSTSHQSNNQSNNQSINRLLDHPRVECVIHCSAKQLFNVSDVFYFAERAVLCPMFPVYNRSINQLTNQSIKALLRLFRLFDQDGDRLISKAELSNYQATVHSKQLTEKAMQSIKLLLLKQNRTDLVVENNQSDDQPISQSTDQSNFYVTFRGFCVLHELLLIKTRRAESIWKELDWMGYDQSISLSNSYLSINQSASQANKQTNDASDWFGEFHQSINQWLIDIFHRYDQDHDGLLSLNNQANNQSNEQPIRQSINQSNNQSNNHREPVIYQSISHPVSDMDDIFATSDVPFTQDDYQSINVIQSSTKPIIQSINLGGWLSLWASLCYRHPQQALKYLCLIGYHNQSIHESKLFLPFEQVIALHPSRIQSRSTNQAISQSIISCLIASPDQSTITLIMDALINKHSNNQSVTQSLSFNQSVSQSPLQSSLSSPSNRPSISQSVNQSVSQSSKSSTQPRHVINAIDETISQTTEQPIRFLQLTELPINQLQSNKQSINQSISQSADIIALHCDARDVQSINQARLCLSAINQSINRSRASLPLPVIVVVTGCDMTNADQSNNQSNDQSKVGLTLEKVKVLLDHKCTIFPLADRNQSTTQSSQSVEQSNNFQSLFSLLFTAAHNPSINQSISCDQLRSRERTVIGMTALGLAGVSLAFIMAYVRWMKKYKS